MAYRQQGKSDLLALGGLMILAVVAAYFLEVAGECVRTNLAAWRTPSLSDVLDHLAGYHLLVSGAAGFVPVWACISSVASFTPFASPSSRPSQSWSAWCSTTF